MKNQFENEKIKNKPILKMQKIVNGMNNLKKNTQPT